jgi:hypothetical protein
MPLLRRLTFSRCLPPGTSSLCLGWVSRIIETRRKRTQFTTGIHRLRFAPMRLNPTIAARRPRRREPRLRLGRRPNYELSNFFDCLGETAAPQIHHKRENITSALAAVAIENLATTMHKKRGMPFAMQWAETDELSTTRMKLSELRNKVRQVHSRLHQCCIRMRQGQWVDSHTVVARRFRSAISR